MRQAWKIVIGVSVLWAFVGFSAEVVPPKPEKLVVSWWGLNLDLLNKNIAKPFEEKYGIKIEWDVGDNAPRLARLIANKDNPIHDVAAFSLMFGLRAVEAGVLQPYRSERIPNLNNIYEWARDPLGGQYGIGFTVHCIAIYYREDKVSPPITSWKDFWRPELKGRISWPEFLTTYGPYLMMMASKIWGESEYDVEVGFAKLKELIEHVLTFYRRSSEMVMLFQQGEIWASPAASFAWGLLEALDLPLVKVYPEEGCPAEVNIVGVVKGTPNAYWAEEFINFLLSYEVQLAQAMDLVDSPVNKFVEVPPEKAKNLIIGEELISRLIFFDPRFVAANLENWSARWDELRR